MPQQPRLLLGISAASTRALDRCVRYAPGRDTVVLSGEPGTGKTVLAEYIHRHSRRPGEFVKVSASHIPQHLELAHLGGHSRGAFTGAETNEMGRNRAGSAVKSFSIGRQGWVSSPARSRLHGVRAGASSRVGASWSGHRRMVRKWRTRIGSPAVSPGTGVISEEGVPNDTGRLDG
ncbi:MAG: sigma 54-interacting transcriptional regulator [Gemmatimonadales bacterium]